MILPPKRFQSVDDPCYDNIRHKKWFWKLIKRREKLPALRQAMLSQAVDGLNQKDSAEKYGVDERELRDYEIFHDPSVGRETINPAFQRILNDSYHVYCADGAKESIVTYIERIAPFYGKKGRHVWEKFEVDPNFYPDNYVHPKPK